MHVRIQLRYENMIQPVADLAQSLQTTPPNSTRMHLTIFDHVRLHDGNFSVTIVQV